MIERPSGRRNSDPSPNPITSGTAPSCHRRHLDNGLFDLWCGTVLQDRLHGQLAAFVVQLLEPIEAVAAVAHHLAGLAHIAELLGQLQQPQLRPDNLLLLRYVVISVPPRARAVPVRTAPALR